MKLAATMQGMAVLALAAHVFGCAKDGAIAKPKAPSVATTGASAADVQAAADREAARALAGATGPGVTTEGLHLSEAIAKACNLPRTEPTAHFAFDSTALPEGDREILAALAKCLSGPLTGKSVLLTGRADARGESEYNMGLGESRSNAVKRYLVDLGVADGRVRASSRGEMDAVGTDEESMAKDRRVDIDVR